MQKYYKKSFYIFITTIFLIILYIVISFYVNDPLQVWHKSFFRKPTYSYTIRESAKAFTRDYNFDSIIVGNSFSENISSKEAAKILGGTFFNFSMSGSTIYEKNILINYLLKQKKIKKVIYFLDNHYIKLRTESLGYSSKNYDFLYNDNIFDDYKIYMNSKYFVCTLFWKNTSECIGTSLDMDRPYKWENQSEHTKRFGGFENWLKYKNNIQVAQDFENLLNTPSDINSASLDLTYIKNMEEYFNYNLFSLIEENPNVEFYIIIPPVSDFEHARRLRDTDLSFKKYSYMLSYLTKEQEKYKNMHIYAFDDIKDIGNIEKYKDLSHYKNEINYFILDSISKSKHQINNSNLYKYLDNVNEKILNFDFNYYINQIKMYK